MGSAGMPGARAPRRPGCGGRVCKGAGAPDEGPSVGCGTSGKGAAWRRVGAVQGRSSVGRRRGAVVWGRAGARRGAAQGRSVGLRRGCAGAQPCGAVQGRSRVGRRRGAAWCGAGAQRGAA